MEISGGYSVGNLWNLEDIENTSSRKKSQSLANSGSRGDTVEISSEAKKLFSQMIHKYDKSSSPSGDSGQASDSENPSAQESGGAGGGESDTSSIEKIKNQIQSLKSQLSALAGQIGGGFDAAAMSKMSALEAQIAALEAQLNEMGA